jgi:glucose 1-dehydrogenase
MSSPERRVALVTGAGGGIGRVVARQLADDGAAIIVLDIDRAAAEETVAALGADVETRVVQADVRDKQELERELGPAAEELGGIDVVVHSAGVLKTARLLKLPEEDWDTVFDTNAKGRFLVSQIAAKSMIEHGRGGVIVDIGSITTDRVAPGRLHYCVSNATADALMRAMAVDLGKYGIRVVTVSTGPVDTTMLGGRADDPDRLARFTQMIPLGRIAQPSDVADAVRFVVSPQARYITGSVLHLDGGWTAA